MLFSIVMPTYKTRIEVIDRAVRSIYQQSYKSWELIIVDDNHADSEYKNELKEYASRVPSQVKIIFHEDNKGANAARNTGIENAKGDYIAFLDSDDEWDSDFLECVYSAIQKNSSDIISCRYRIATNEGIYESPVCDECDGNKYNKLIYEDCVGPTSAVVVRKTSLIHAGMFDVTLPARQDYDMWIRVSKNDGTVAYVREPKLTIYRNGEESISTRGLNTINGTEMVLKKILTDRILLSNENEIRYCHYMQCGRNAASLSRYDVAKKYFKQALDNKKTMKALLFLTLSVCPPVYKIIRNGYRKNRIKGSFWVNGE